MKEVASSWTHLDADLIPIEFPNQGPHRSEGSQLGLDVDGSSLILVDFQVVFSYYALVLHFYGIVRYE